MDSVPFSLACVFPKRNTHVFINTQCRFDPLVAKLPKWVIVENIGCGYTSLRRHLNQTTRLIVFLEYHLHDKAIKYGFLDF